MNYQWWPHRNYKKKLKLRFGDKEKNVMYIKGKRNIEYMKTYTYLKMDNVDLKKNKSN